MTRIEKIAAARPAGIILREKELTPGEYIPLAEAVLEICRRAGTLCILHGFPQAAKKLDCAALHLPLPVLRTLSETDRRRFAVLGASCHSGEDAVEAERLGCTYITAGHIFGTDCKKGLPGRGIAFLQEVCRSVSIPVYAIGGINAANYPRVLHAGAKGVCVMSGLMTCRDPQEYLAAFKED